MSYQSAIGNGFVMGMRVGTLGACILAPFACGTSDTLVNSGSYAQQFVGARRVAVVGDAAIFSDYVFGADGSLSHLRSVASGQIVSEAEGAGAVRGTDGSTCVFGAHWYSLEDTELVIEGACTDGKAREIALTISEATVSQQLANVGATWMEPTAWRIQRCDHQACAE